MQWEILFLHIQCILFKAKNLYTEWCIDGPTGAGFNVTDNGWMEEHAFYAWICHFIKNVEEIPRPILLLYDGHKSHTSFRILRKATENGITILKLPPHTSHLLQPLDVGVFRPAKAVWRKILDQFFKHSWYATVYKSSKTAA